MKIQIASDLHLDQYSKVGLSCPFRVQPSADLVVFAGDIGAGLQGMDFARQLDVPVIYVPGNWEHYELELDDTALLMKFEAVHSKVIVLQNETAFIGGIRFLGTTLWSDFKASRFTQEANMSRAAFGMNDYRHIWTRNLLATPEDILARHQFAVAWLEGELEKEFNGTTVVISHHAPHPNSIPRRWIGHPLEASYVSRMTGLMRSVNLWIHGHVHAGCDYQIRGCRVVCNPLGGISSPRIPDSVTQRSRPYDPSLLVEVN